MNYESQSIQFDERVDHYLRGRMSEEEELAFEIEYLENPDLLAQVEMVEQLIQGLKLNESALAYETHATDTTAQIAESTAEYKTERSSWQQWLQQWFTPQTAWGAIAATVFLVPLMSIMNNQPGAHSANLAVEGTYVHLLGQRVRSTTRTTDTIYIEPDQSNVVIGFATEPTFGVPEPLTVTVYNTEDQILWQQQGLQPDYRWTVYLSVHKRSITPGEYRYELTNGDSIVNSGTFAMAYAEP